MKRSLLIILGVIVGYIVMYLNIHLILSTEQKAKSELKQIWMCNRIFGVDTPAPYGCEVFDSCLYYLNFWEPIHKEDTIRTVTLDFVPIYRIQ